MDPDASGTVSPMGDSGQPDQGPPPLELEAFDETPSNPMRRIDPAMLERILGEVLSDPEARKRREEVRAGDPRTDEEIAAIFGDFGLLVDELRARLAVLEAEAERSDETPLELAAEDVIEIGELAPADEELAPEAPPDALPPVPKKKKKRKPRKVYSPEERRLQAASLLYEDVLWLLSVNDGEGALISLERLLVGYEPEGEIKEFLQLNEAKLLNLYEGYIGPFDKVPKKLKLAKGHGMPDAYLAEKRIQKMLKLVNGKSTITKLLKQSKMPPLQACCILNQLRRSGLIEI